MVFLSCQEFTDNENDDDDDDDNNNNVNSNNNLSTRIKLDKIILLISLFLSLFLDINNILLNNINTVKKLQLLAFCYLFLAILE